jgi:hypothetical protein
LIPVIQRKGSEQGVSVEGWSAHYAHDQANLLLAEEDLYRLLTKVVAEAKRAKGRNPLGPGMSSALLKEAEELLKSVYHRA